MTDPEDAWKIILENTIPLPGSTVGLEDGAGSVLASDIRADRDIPAADRAAMDGYAVRSEDLVRVPARLCVIGEIAAGGKPLTGIGPGECIRIFTGANLPAGADAVVMVEDTVEADGGGSCPSVVFGASVKRGENVFRRGENAACGDVVIARGSLLDSANMGICAAVGAAVVPVHARPRIGVLCTGAELLDACDTAESHQLRNSNGPTIAEAFRARGFRMAGVWRAGDDAAAISGAVVHALDGCDLLVVTGGVSVGRYDLVPEALGLSGIRILYHGLNMKPGKPQLFALAAGGKPVFCLPGNPLSSITCLHEFVLPAARRLAGLPPSECRRCLYLRVARGVKCRKDSRRYVPGRIIAEGGCMSVEPVDFEGTADFVAAGRADGAVLVERGVDIGAGDTAPFRLWRILE